MNTISYDPALFAYLSNIEQRHFWYTARKEIILDQLKKQRADLSHALMLEVGCGNGNILAYLKHNGCNVEGGDLLMEGLKYCRRSMADVPLYQIDILHLPFKNTYDIIGLFDVLEHIPDDGEALRQIADALKPGGHLIITVPAYKFLWGPFDEISHHKRRYIRKELADILKSHGFEVKRVTYYMFLLFPVLATIRLIHKLLYNWKGASSSGDFIELTVIPMVNEVFLAIFRLEKMLLRLTDLPFGTSLIAVAQKKQI